MAERKGFWTPRRRKGLQDAQLLATERLHELRQLRYAELPTAAAVEELTGLGGERFVRRTTVRRFERAGEGNDPRRYRFPGEA